MKTAYFLHLAGASILLGTLCAPGAAHAQYVWLDDKGVKQYSDMPPPSSVPAKQILKQPGQRPRSSEATTAGAGTAGTDTVQQPKTLAEQNAEFKKRRTEQAEKEKKAAEETRLATEKSKNCERARNYQRTLDSGERVVRTDANGERTFLTDEQRAQEQREARQILQDCK